MENHPEAQALVHSLDKLYRRLRHRARADWMRSHPGKEPSDACVSVHIRCSSGERLCSAGSVD